MGLLTKNIETLDDAFVHVLQTTYYAEKQITKALPKMIDKATSPELKQGFETHVRETETTRTAWSRSSACTAPSRRKRPAQLSMAS